MAFQRRSGVDGFVAVARGSHVEAGTAAASTLGFRRVLARLGAFVIKINFPDASVEIECAGAFRAFDFHGLPSRSSDRGLDLTTVLRCVGLEQPYSVTDAVIR